MLPIPSRARASSGAAPRSRAMASARACWSRAWPVAEVRSESSPRRFSASAWRRLVHPAGAAVAGGEHQAAVVPRERVAHHVAGAGGRARHGVELVLAGGRQRLVGPGGTAVRRGGHRVVDTAHRVAGLGGRAGHPLQARGARRQGLGGPGGAAVRRDQRRLAVPGGTVWPVHVAPPSVVATTWPPPTAQQVLVEVQATPVRLPVPAGAACGVQTDPPSVVATTWPPVAPAFDPTA